MKRRNALVPTPTSRDWKGTHASKGLLHEGRLYLLPSYAAYILESIDPVPNGTDAENSVALEMVERERRRRAILRDFDEKEEGSDAHTMLKGLEGD